MLYVTHCSSLTAFPNLYILMHLYHIIEMLLVLYHCLTLIVPLKILALQLGLRLNRLC